ncbi:MAG: hypothetical protein DID89_2727547782 [Candidatus Nitrotoga sp. CP45]|nr:MAG: hypothetical protein DID89_2727547782 [Candidatus Nitrotoga sp. CP45]
MLLQGGLFGWMTELLIKSYNKMAATTLRSSPIKML